MSEKINRKTILLIGAVKFGLRPEYVNKNVCPLLKGYMVSICLYAKMLVFTSNETTFIAYLSKISLIIFSHIQFAAILTLKIIKHILDFFFLSWWVGG